VIQPVVLPRNKTISILVYSRTVTFVRESKIEDMETFQDEVGHFLDLLRNDGKLNEMTDSAARLYDWLIRPIEKELAGARLLVVSGSGRLRKVPFQALFDSRQKKYLAEILPVVNLALLKQLDVAKHSQTELHIFAMANPDPNDPQLALPKAEEQVKNIASAFPDMRTYLHEDAVIDKLRWKENDNNYNVLLFATHALLDDENPANSHILLAKGQKLTYENIPEFSPFWPHVQMVVLSACDTAVAPRSDNSAIDSLAENFDLIGIRSVVASLWQVNDDSTSILMTKFFENIKGGVSLAEALRNAQLSLIQDEKYGHPFHWAPFILIGDWR
jgi:CHAT domain-containing protein